MELHPLKMLEIVAPVQPIVGVIAWVNISDGVEAEIVEDIETL